MSASTARPSETKSRIVEAAVRTLKEEGFAGTSARAIAKRGDFNQALIFYHFGSVSDLLLAALDRTSEERMQAYRDAVEGIATIDDAVRVATELYREDLASGHITVLAELIGGSLAHPDLAPRIVERLEPWIDLTERAVRNVLGPLAEMLDPRVVAYAIVALYLGIDLLSHLEGDDARAEGLFETASATAALFGKLT